MTDVAAAQPGRNGQFLWRCVDGIYRAKKAGVADTLTLDQWGGLLESTQWSCAWCGLAENIQVEHLIPISRGGGNTLDNVCPLCSFCNFNKGAKMPLEWIWQK